MGSKGDKKHRVFDNKRYALLSYYANKASAVYAAKRLREQGRLARVVVVVVDAGTKWASRTNAVYWRKK